MHHRHVDRGTAREREGLVVGGVRVEGRLPLCLHVQRVYQGHPRVRVEEARVDQGGDEPVGALVDPGVDVLGRLFAVGRKWFGLDASAEVARQVGAIRVGGGEVGVGEDPVGHRDDRMVGLAFARLGK